MLGAGVDLDNGTLVLDECYVGARWVLCAWYFSGG